MPRLNPLPLVKVPPLVVMAPALRNAVHLAHRWKLKHTRLTRGMR